MQFYMHCVAHYVNNVTLIPSNKIYFILPANTLGAWLDVRKIEDQASTEFLLPTSVNVK